MPHHPVSEELASCIATCLYCYETCAGTFASHCLETGGRHVEPGHARLMLACAEICRTAAHTMMLQAAVHSTVCGACADVCERCAHSCEALGDMTACVQACRSCAQSCQAMATAGGAARGTAMAGAAAGHRAHQ